MQNKAERSMNQTQSSHGVERLRMNGSGGAMTVDPVPPQKPAEGRGRLTLSIELCCRAGVGQHQGVVSCE